MAAATQRPHPVHKALKRVWKPVRKAIVLTTLSMLGFFACQDGSDALLSDTGDGDREVVFRHFI